MGETILEIIFSFFQEVIPHIIKLIGALVRWAFFLGRKNFITIINEEWNKRIGFLTVVIIVALIIVLNN